MTGATESTKPGALMSVRTFLRVAVAVAALAAPPALAQSTGAVSGRVMSASSGAPVIGAFILVDGGAPKAQTNVEGRYRVGGLSVGTHTIEARRGTATAATKVHVSAGAVATADFTLRDAPPVLAAVTVIGTRTDLDETRARAAEVPGAVSVVGPDEIRATRQANLKDVLEFTPGVYVQSRFGAADESQISVRGSGLRNNFHARGINLLVNGMPYRNADGFTDFESLEMLTTEAIEVYKGANALRYGGSTLGGAINLATKTGHTAAPVAAFAQGGAFGFFKGQVASGGVRGRLDYYVSYARTDLDNYRAWSDQKRDRVNLHAGYRLGSKVDARSFYFFAHVREHLPGALTRAELESNPRQAVPINVTNRWGRDYDLHHAGLQIRVQLTPAQRLELSPYVQYRDIDHPIFEVIAQVSRDYGAEMRYENTAPLGRRSNRFTLGAQTALGNLDNRQYQNQGGGHGPLTRDEKDEATNLSLYAEDALEVTNRLSLVLGARLDHSRRAVEDYFLANGDQSDERVYDPVTPRVGIRYDLPQVGGNFFANASRTVEPPLLLELSSFGNAGGFVDLDAQKAWQYEVGARGRRLGLAWELSVYDVELTDEILNVNVRPFPNAPFTVPSYRNAERSRHYGVEAGLAWLIPGAVFVRGGDGRDYVTTRIAYTYGRFKYVKDAAYGGNDIPGAPAHHVNAELRYAHPSGFSIAPRIEWVPRSYFVDSDNTVTNNAWAALGLRAEWAVAGAGVTAFVEGRNLLDERYSASVQVDNAAGRFYEPADRRAVYAGLRWSR
jgi:iron complex outermembrane recepter protein